MFVELEYRSRLASGSPAIAGHRARAVFGQVRGLVALTVGCLALGEYMGRDLTGGAAIALSVDAVICRIGLNSASADGREALTAFLASYREAPVAARDSSTLGSA